MSLALTLLAATAWWFTLAPRAVGGPLSAVVVDGTSMQPRFHTGDVVIVRRHASYHLGDIVAVKVDGGEVIHRLVAGNASTGWRTKGINRRTMDSWVIPNDHILGAQWVFLPGAGNWTGWVRQPQGAGIAAAAIAILCALVPSKRRRSRGGTTLERSVKQARHAAKRAANDAPSWAPQVPTRIEPAVLGGTALATIAGAMVCLTWWVPGSRIELVARPAPMLTLAATIVAVVLAGGCLLVAARVYRGFGGAPADKAYARLRERLVPVRSIATQATIVTVASPRELRRISDACVAPVVHEVTPSGHRFAVLSEGVAYVLTVAAPSSGLDCPTERTADADTDGSVSIALIPAGTAQLESSMR